jgi:hypothetical protein
MEVPMTAVSRALSWATGRPVHIEVVKIMATVVAAFAFVAILYASEGLDLSAGFF